MYIFNSNFVHLYFSVCRECAQSNRHYFISEKAALTAYDDTSDKAMQDIVDSAQAKFEKTNMEWMLRNFERQHQVQLLQNQVHSNPLPNTLASQAEDQPSNTVPQGIPIATIDIPPPPTAYDNNSGTNISRNNHAVTYDNDNKSTVLSATISQVKALAVKNVLLQSKQSCSNCCRCVDFFKFSTMKQYKYTFLYFNV